VLSDIISLSKGTVRVLIYNGDVDTACDFLGDEWFGDRVAAKNNLEVASSRSAWSYKGDTGGYVKRYKTSANAYFDILTVQGAGHFVPTDRGGAALQMLVNFLRNSDDYSTPAQLNTTPRPTPSTQSPQ